MITLGDNYCFVFFYSTRFWNLPVRWLACIRLSWLPKKRPKDIEQVPSLLALDSSSIMQTRKERSY